MAKYEIFIKSSTVKELEGIGTKREHQRIVARIQELTGNPRPPGFRKLSGADKYRIRCANDHVVYSIDDDELLVQIVKTGQHREIYR